MKQGSPHIEINPDNTDWVGHRNLFDTTHVGQQGLFNSSFHKDMLNKPPLFCIKI